MQPSIRMQAVQSPIIAVVGELIRDNPGTISLGQGISFYPPPDRAWERMVHSLAEPSMHTYTHVAGIDELREILRAKLTKDNGITVDSGSHIVVTAGGNMAFVNAVLAICDPGDEVIILAPYYFNHEMAIRIANSKPVVVPTDTGYQPHVEAIRRAITPRTRAIVTISPNNPSGAVYDEASLRAVNALCQDRGLYHINDEAYEYFTYDNTRHFSPGAIEGASAHTISLFSLSKSFGFAGWRIGYMVIPDLLLSAVKKIQDTNLICPPVASQYAAMGALEAGSDYCRQFLPSMDSVRHLILQALTALGNRVTVPTPKGAFYFFLNVRTDMDAEILVRRLIEEYGVAVIPGQTFGMDNGCYLRIAYGALQKETVATAVDRLVIGLNNMS